MNARRGGIPGPESRTGLVRPAMSEAEFERRQAQETAEPDGHPPANGPAATPPPQAEPEPAPRGSAPAPAPAKARAARGKPAKSRRVQRMFAIEEDVDKKLWLYAIHVGKDRSEVVNDLLRPLVASMVLYDSRDRRSGRAAEPEGQGDGPDA
jgi:hypothetical protein